MNTETMAIIILLASFGIMILLRFPIAYAVALSSMLCLLYLGGYGLGRFIIEGIRTDTLFIPGTQVPVSQVLAILMVVFALGADIAVRIRLKKKEDSKVIK